LINSRVATTIFYSLLLSGLGCTPAIAANVTAHLAATRNGKERKPPAVIWLKPLQATMPDAPIARYSMLQKDKSFSPHLLVVPVGSTVVFPNADPFFHNVFSLFDGRRFDLGLYEAGSARSIVFSREGVSYIFCNIHPDMSAVVLSLTTPFFSVADGNGMFRLHDVPEGNYELHIWVEGRRDDALNHLTRRVHVNAGPLDLGEIQPGPQDLPAVHLNKFGHPYPEDQKPAY